MSLETLERRDLEAQLAPISPYAALCDLVADLKCADLYAVSSKDDELRLRIRSALTTATLLRNAQRPT